MTGIQHCVNCGDPFRGSGDLCPDCVPMTERKTEPLPPAVRAGRPPLPPPTATGTRCPYCAQALDWDNIRRYTRRTPPGQIEVAYFCPACRCVLEFASWVEVPPPAKPR